MDRPRTDTVRLQEMARAYCQSALLFSAIDIDLFTAVAKGQDTEAKLASVLDLSALDTERLVTACLAMGLLAWEGDRLVNAPDVQRFLVRGEPGYAGPWMTFTRPDVGKWFEMTTYLRSKEPPRLLGAIADFTVEDARRYHEATNEALLPGGEMHLVGEMLDDDRTAPLDAALWGLGELVYQSGGKSHTVGQCRGYFEKAGFADVSDHDFVPGVLRRVSGVKRL